MRVRKEQTSTQTYSQMQDINSALEPLAHAKRNVDKQNNLPFQILVYRQLFLTED